MNDKIQVSQINHLIPMLKAKFGKDQLEMVRVEMPQSNWEAVIYEFELLKEMAERQTPLILPLYEVDK